ncbi:aminoacyl tRNA synthase complex-interacting multifunctional protein 1a [Triplophysa rosa]|uniref:Aminoacyl tRNA synthase complex-interacting multifunctional protein 1 n=1 Tax=Triplophysa rosa TaxID=992332 RepID=A0A9W8C9E7_TRIRA|nr:aminoacyl tRNA synthase complex-interacting multifunctional protein 1a [Triplophysa rosa]KAI7811303.1 aminoacyl tRNA synthase complex-interacting multifunctional protein 1 [Triplophysa rosa]
MFLVRSLFKMSGHTPSLLRLEQKAVEADQIIEYLKKQVQILKENAIVQATVREEKKLMVENAKLKKDIEILMKQLLEKERARGVKDMAMPSVDHGVQCVSKPTSAAPSAPAASAPAPVPKNPPAKDNDATKKMKAEKKGEKKEKKAAAPPQEDAKVDVSRLDLRVGRIITAEKHPDADSLYVEQVDVGEAAPRTVVSGLVKHIPLDQMQNRMAVLLCNLKPAKMRGVLSQAMVMCASSLEKVEILDPPSGAVPGDRVSCQGFPGEPDKELNPKKKVWEQVQPDLRTDDKCVATYKGAAFEVAGKGVCKAQTMNKSSIK